jgi:hypothetical protein
MERRWREVATLLVLGSDGSLIIDRKVETGRLKQEAWVKSGKRIDGRVKIKSG